MSVPMIRAVQEFFCAHGRCREVLLAVGPRHPVLLSVEQMGALTAKRGGRAGETAALRIKYRGREADLIALGCICRDSLAAARRGRAESDRRGESPHVQSKAAPGRRRRIEVSYFARSRAFAGRLPGVRTYCGDWLEAMTAPPMLRLVIDNTRRGAGPPTAEPSARLAGA